MTRSLRRRDFVGMAIAAALPLRAAEPSLKFPTDPRERLSVSTYPFRKIIASHHGSEGHPAKGGITLADFAQTVQAKLNVRGIEPWSHHFESTDPAYVQSLGDAFRRAGLHVVNVPVDIRVKLCGTAEERERSLADYRKWVDAAVTLQSPSIRVHLPHGEQGDEITCAVESLRMLAQYGAAKNIVVNIENDEPSVEQPERVAKVIKTVNSPYLRALPDFCNSMLVHDDQSYNDRALGTLFSLAYNVSHVKDSEQDGAKTYRVDVHKIFAIAKKAGYKGYFSMELESEEEPYAGTGKLIEASLKNLA